jgi:hypothetical protein
MPEYKIGWWVRVFVTAPSKPDTDRVGLHESTIAGAIVIRPGELPVTLNDVEVDWQDTTEYDSDGEPAARWDEFGEHRPPDD